MFTLGATREQYETFHAKHICPLYWDKHAEHVPFHNRIKRPINSAKPDSPRLRNTRKALTPQN